MTAPSSEADLARDLVARLAAAAEPALSGKVLGLIGYGALGRHIACHAARRGLEVIYADPEPGAGPCRRVLLGELLARSDFVMPLSAEAANTLRDERFFVLLKPGARLIEPA